MTSSNDPEQVAWHALSVKGLNVTIGRLTLTPPQDWRYVNGDLVVVRSLAEVKELSDAYQDKLFQNYNCFHYYGGV